MHRNIIFKDSAKVPEAPFTSLEMDYLLGGVERTPKIHGSYIREAWQNGLAMQGSRGYNPYKMGFVGASDSHNTASGYSQNDYSAVMVCWTPRHRSV